MGKYILVARDIFDKCTIIDIKINGEYKKINPLILIDKMTSKYFTSLQDFKTRTKNGEYYYSDIYIVHKKKGKDELEFFEPLFKDSNKTLLNLLDEIDTNKIGITNSKIISFVGNLAYRLKKEPAYKEYLSKIFPHLRFGFDDLVNNSMKISDINYKTFIEKISDYKTIRKIIMVTDVYDKKLDDKYVDRIRAIYPVYVYASDKLSNYKEDKLFENMSLEEFKNKKYRLINREINLPLEEKEEIDLDRYAFYTEEELDIMAGLDELGNRNKLK